MANKPDDNTVEVEVENPDLRKDRRLPRPKRRLDNRMLKPNGRTHSYETK